MTISWYGEACFLLESGGIRILIEPLQKDSGINLPRLKSDILIYSKPRNEKPEVETFIIEGPGEYEIKGINILGIADEENTLYNIKMDDIKIAHLGFVSKDLDDEKLTFLNEPDIVLVPVGGGLPAPADTVLGAEAAMNLINKIEPSIVVPMLYNIKGLKIKRAALSVFLKESGAKESPQPKLTIKKKDLIEEETKIVILEKV